jgi:hypothetical protein
LLYQYIFCRRCWYCIYVGLKFWTELFRNTVKEADDQVQWICDM